MRFCLFIIIIALFTSCAPMYVPNARNVPLFNGQGEFQGSVFLGTGVDVQGALAVSDHVGIIGSYSILSQNSNDPLDPTQTFKRKNSYFEGGLGYFNATRGKRVELYVGYGQGKGTTTGQYSFFFQTFGQQEIIVTGKYNRIFLQPSIGTNNRGFNLAFTPRISYVDFYEFQSGIVIEKPNEKAHLFIEPAATGKFKLGTNVDGIFQLGLNLALAGDVFFDHVPIQAGLGLQLHLGGGLRTKVYKR